MHNFECYESRCLLSATAFMALEQAIGRRRTVIRKLSLVLNVAISRFECSHFFSAAPFRANRYRKGTL